MRFSARKFFVSADGVCKKLLPQSHRQALDGKEVVDEQIEYAVGGQEYYLYPVLPEWCDV